MNKTQSERLGQLFVKWNGREINGNDAMYEVSKIFRRICLRAWREAQPVPIEEKA